MAGWSRSHAWRDQPPAGVVLDRDNPITRGLVGLVDPRTGRDVAIAQSTAWTKTGEAVSRWSGAQTIDSGRYDTTPRNNWRPTTDKASLLLLRNSTAAYGGTTNIADNYGAMKLVDRYGVGTPSFSVVTSGTSATSIDGSGTWSTTNEQLAVLTADGATATLFIDGVVRGSATCTGNLVYEAFGFSAITSAAVNTGSIHLLGMWARALTQKEIQSLKENPWQLFASLPRWIWAPAAAGGTTAAAGSIAASASVVGVGASSATANASIAASLSDVGVGAATSAAAASIAGTLSMVGVGTGSAITAAAGSIAASASVAGVGASTSSAAASSPGALSVTGVGASVAAADVSSAGVLNVQGVGALSSGIVAASGSIAGSASMIGVGASTAGAAANISGVLNMTGETIRASRRSEGRRVKKPTVNQDERDLMELAGILVPVLCGSAACLH